MNSYLDEQGHKVKLGVAYLYIFAMPGPDTTCLIVESMNEDGTVNCYDVLFKMKVENIQTGKLWRPLKHTWSRRPGELRAITDYLLAQALDLTP